MNRILVCLFGIMTEGVFSDLADHLNLFWFFGLNISKKEIEKEPERARASGQTARASRVEKDEALECAPLLRVQQIRARRPLVVVIAAATSSSILSHDSLT